VPIPEQELERRIVVVDARASLAELLIQARELSTPPRYVVVELDGGQFAAVTVGEISQAVDRLGPAALDVPLDRLPATNQPTGAVERMALGFGEAERLRDRQPNRRLVVTEAGRPLGLMVNEARGSSVTGVPFDLFGSYMPGGFDHLLAERSSAHPSQACPRCGQEFVFYELDPRANAFACPHCHSVLAQD